VLLNKPQINKSPPHDNTHSRPNCTSVIQIENGMPNTNESGICWFSHTHTHTHSVHLLPKTMVNCYLKVCYFVMVGYNMNNKDNFQPKICECWRRMKVKWNTRIGFYKLSSFYIYRKNYYLGYRIKHEQNCWYSCFQIIHRTCIKHSLQEVGFGRPHHW
jgi:hypothetical protein